MVTKQKKNSQKEQNNLPKSERSPWKTPTGIAALIGALAALITALVAAIQVFQAETSSAQKSSGNCDQYFVGNVVETQMGVPDAVSIKNTGLIIIKIRQNSELIGSIRIIPDNPDGPVFFLGEANCVQVLGATKFQFNKWNEIIITDHQIEFKYDDVSKTLSIR
jgi:hypothetical protein